MTSSNIIQDINVTTRQPAQSVSTESAYTQHSLKNFSQTEVPEGCLVVMQTAEFLPWDNADNLISQETEQWVELVVNGVTLPILFIISSVTNVINMAVFYRHGLKERVNLCLFALSFVDFVYVLQSFVLYVDKLYLAITGDSRVGVLTLFFVKNMLLGLTGFSWASGFMSAVVACERCFCIVSPLKSKTFLETKTMAMIILVSTVLIVGGMFVVMAQWDVVCVFDPVSLSTSHLVFPSKFFLDNRQVLELFDAVVYGIAMPGFCLTTVTIATLVIGIKLRQMATWREQSSSAASMSSRDLALTRMLVATSILFIVSLLPALVLRVAIFAEPELSLSGRYYNTFNLLISFSQLFTYVNSSVNFFFYYFIGTKYRETVRRMFGKPMEKDVSVMSTSVSHTR
ncbi:hypothetical protein BaRGS_00038376 [Batillaria attramentaria]|uniref:G-protein coupled receptors family 1 profile domain-containing protein n=1 Tax=Batillaria attramentaria TaxID=370345 RepID=A0ABD0J6K9_9CAEN